MSDLAVILVTAPPPGQMPDDAAMTKIDGRESALRTMEMFTNREGIASTTLVVNAVNAEEVKRKIGSHLMFMGIGFVEAGPTWFEQLHAAGQRLKPEIKHVLVHDAARPSVAYTDLDLILSLTGQHDAVTLACKLPGLIVAGAVPGMGQPTQGSFAECLTPTLYSRAAFDTVCKTREQPADMKLIEGSFLNVRCGTRDAAFVKAMIGLLPKPKIKPRSSPFEEAQW